MGAAMVVNTVPALVVTEKIIRELPRDAYIVDIASGGGRYRFCMCEGIRHPCGPCAWNPGKYAPKESAYILERSVERFILKEKQGKCQMDFDKYNIGFGITGSFCTFAKARKAVEHLCEMGQM